MEFFAVIKLNNLNEITRAQIAKKAKKQKQTDFSLSANSLCRPESHSWPIAKYHAKQISKSFELYS